MQTAAPTKVWPCSCRSSTTRWGSRLPGYERVAELQSFRMLDSGRHPRTVEDFSSGK